MMTPDAKAKLSKTIRALRARLLTELSEAVDRQYKLTLDPSRLDNRSAVLRRRLEDWLAEQVRTQSGKVKRTREDFRRDAEKQAAYTLLNRLVILRIMEAEGLRKPEVLTGGWNSRGYKDFRELAPALVRSDDAEGYGFLLKLVFEDLAIDLPGLYGSAGIADLIPVPAATLRAVVETLDDAELQSCWSDDMTLGWVYQFWNDPERESLDAKINGGGKIEPHEIASKTQMFTERYMVDWLLQNSLGPMWLAMCQKHGWTPAVVADGTLERLEQRRTEWRAKRDERQAAIVAFRSAKGTADGDSGEVNFAERNSTNSPALREGDGQDARFAERNATIDESRLPGVSLTDLMPLETEAERCWAYYVPQPIPDDAVQNAPTSVRDLKIIDPAVGSGHFLVVAFDLLFALYREEARHRGISLSPFAPRKEEPPAAPPLSPFAPRKEHPTDTPPAAPSDIPQSEPQLWTDTAIIERILEHNLHGIDLDPRAVQIAAAALWLKAQKVALRSAKDAGVTFAERKPTIRQLNLVASNLGISRLADNDPSLVELRRVIEKETGIPGKLTMQIVEALKGADHLGSLLKIDQAIETAIATYEEESGWRNKVVQISLFPDGTRTTRPRPISREWATTGILSALENFLSQHTSSEELGLRLAGEQLAAGVRFVRLVKEGAYDLVVANPPYQGTSKMADSSYIATHYKLAKADLFAAFLLRGLQLVREHGVSAMLTMRNWMFIKQYSELRQHLLKTFDLRALGDFDRGAFEEILDEVVAVCVAVFERTPDSRLSLRERNATCELKPTIESVAQCPTSRDDRSRDNGRTERKRAATLCHVGRHTFDPAALQVVPEWPLVYWWGENSLLEYSSLPKIGETSPARQGLSTGDNTRFLRLPHEVLASQQYLDIASSNWSIKCPDWVPLIKGADGRMWCDPVCQLITWRWSALEMKLMEKHGKPLSFIRNETFYFRSGVAFTTTGATFAGRYFRHSSVFEAKGRTVFGGDPAHILSVLNSAKSKSIVTSLNPTIDFTVGDVNRLPLFRTENAGDVFKTICSAFSQHESHREPSVEFRQPGPSPWRHAQEWAQLAVDRPDGAPLPEYVEELDPEPPTDHVSFAVGVALGRFGAHGEGILDSRLSLRERNATEGTGDANFAERNSTFGNATDDGGDARFAERNATISTDADFAERNPTLPHGILFLDGTLIGDVPGDSLSHPAARIIHDKWADYGPQIDRRRSVRDWLREKFFADVHKGMYENRPIHWPLSSAKKTFVAWVTIHRWDDKTLRILLADHLEPALKRLDGELADMVKTKATAEGLGEGRKEGRSFRGAKGDNERYADVTEWKKELEEFIKQVKQCAERGPKAPDEKKPEREVDARYIPDLDDGVMINSSALWPLLEPQWKDPKKWWKELVAAKGKKDYDWSHLAMRYWPTRVDEKCRKDPSLAVAHGCFWAYHPARAWAWELRLQDEIGPEFRIEESSLSLRERNATEGGGRGVNFAERNSTIRNATDSSLSLRERNATEGTTDERFAERNATNSTSDANFAERNSTICRAEFLRKYPVEALEAIEKEVLRRKRKRKGPLTELTLLESGLWSKAPADCWELELRLTEKLQVEFRLLAPDEPDSRDAFEKSHPNKAKSRNALLGRLRPPDLFADEEEDLEDEELESESVEDEEGEIEDP